MSADLVTRQARGALRQFFAGHPNRVGRGFVMGAGAASVFAIAAVFFGGAGLAYAVPVFGLALPMLGVCLALLPFCWRSEPPLPEYYEQILSAIEQARASGAITEQQYNLHYSQALTTLMKREGAPHGMGAAQEGMVETDESAT